MNKKIKYSSTFIIIILSIIFSYSANAENAPVACTLDAKTCPDGSSVGRVGPNCEFAPCNGPLNNLNAKIQNNKLKLDEIKNNLNANKVEVKNEINADREALKSEIDSNRAALKSDIEASREAYKNKMNQIIETAKTKREEFNNQLKQKREEVKAKINQIKIDFKDKLNKIKDNNKVISAEKILSGINDLNTNRTSTLNAKIDQIENVLTSINSRISKAENKILDVATLSSKVSSAEKAISEARDAVNSQIAKTYSVSASITDETILKTEMQKLRNTFNTDIKSLNEKVKLAHDAVRNVATELAKVPKLDEEVTSNTVEDNSTITN